MSDTVTDPGPLERSASRLSGPRLLVLATFAIIPFIAVWVFWEAKAAFFLLFSGALLAAVLDAAARGFTRYTPLEHRKSVYLVIAIVVALIAGLVWFAGSTLVAESQSLYKTMDEQADVVGNFIEDVTGREINGSEGPNEDMKPLGVLKELSSLMPGEGGAATAVRSVFGYLANIVIIFFIGVFLVIEPGLYKRGTVSLFKPHTRDAIDGALHEAGETLRLWLIGKLGSMAMIAVFTYAGLTLIGYPSALVLALVAGSLAFIPNIGPLLTYIPIALVGLSADSTTTLIYGLLVYAAAQTIESYIFTPMIQKHMVELPPALILFAQVLGGILFGLWGVALATPLAAVLRVWVKRYHVERMNEQADLPDDARLATPGSATANEGAG